MNAGETRPQAGSRSSASERTAEAELPRLRVARDGTQIGSKELESYPISLEPGLIPGSNERPKEGSFKNGVKVSTPLRWAKIEMPLPTAARSPRSLPGLSLGGPSAGGLSFAVLHPGKSDLGEGTQNSLPLLPADLVLLKQNWPFIAALAIPGLMHFRPENKSWNEEANTLHSAQRPPFLKVT